MYLEYYYIGVVHRRASKMGASFSDLIILQHISSWYIDNSNC
jgi:hypothetical protein